MTDGSFDVICIGNALVDTFLKIHEANEHIRLNSETHEFCIRYGEKNLIDDCQFLLGGNACNLSVGLSRLGFKTALCAETGDDEFSQKIINGLKKDNVELTLLKQIEGTPSAFAIALNFANERTLFVRHVKRQHNFVFDGVLTKWVYLTSLGREWKKAYANVLSFVQNNNLKLAFNPGTPQIEEGVESYINIVKQSEILFVNKTEAQQLTGDSNENDIANLLLKSKNLGPKTVVITDGVNGSWAIDENGKTYKMGIIECKVVQKTGAGDAYTSGFLAAVILGFSIEEAMRWGTINAASVIGKIGAQSGLLTKEEMGKIALENKDFQAEKI